MKKIVLLTIDTSKREEAKIILSIDGTEYIYCKSTDTRKAQVVLPLIFQALKEHDLSFVDISKLYAPLGPGSFTGLRVGASIVNALGSVLHISINDDPPGVLLEPVYE